MRIIVDIEVDGASDAAGELEYVTEQVKQGFVSGEGWSLAE
jgi:hypothetical protein